MKKILIPTDFSEQADNALCAALTIANNTEVELTLLHVLEDPIVASVKITGETHGDPMEKVYVMKLIEKTEEKLQAIVNEDRFKGLSINWKLKFGNPYKNISEIIGKQNSDLVVMGTKGASGIQELLVGSVADKVVRYASCPVITVKECRDLSNIKHIVFATDLKDDQMTIIEDLKKLQKFYDAKLHILKVYDSDWVREAEVNKRIEEFSSKLELSNYTIKAVKGNDEAEEILNYAAELEADMIALGAHDRHGLLHFLTSRISKNVVNHAHRPVWTRSIH